MKTLSNGIFGLIATVMVLYGQLPPEVTAKLRSADWTERRSAYDQITNGGNRTPEATSALVALLVAESAAVRQSMLAGGEDRGEGYAQYTSLLLGTVTTIAEQEPERQDVWPALATCDQDGDSPFGAWLAERADKTARFVMACAKDTNRVFRGQAVAILAQIVAYERARGTAHHLRADEVDSIETVVRGALGDADTYVRMRAVMALAIMGMQSDLAILESIAATDPAFEARTAAEGPQFNPYPVRYTADLAIKRLQAKLKAQQ